jgi:ankyrin repeat protein
MIDIDEELKRAIVNNDIAFFEANRNRIDINHRFEENNYDTLLLYALSDAKSNMHEYFLRNNADVTVINDEGEGVIHSIVYSGLPNRIDQVLKQRNCDINLKTKEGITPILLSVLLGKYEIFSRLLYLGADINIADNEGNVPLHPACFLGYKSMVIDLVENGANLLVKTNKGNYPLALAINGGHDEIVKFLYNHLYRGK